jgi:4-amino-4-deoxy-L-arabinose transferase-like glycosyltransferase
MDWLRRTFTIDVALLGLALILAVALNWSAIVVDYLAIDEHVSFWIADGSGPSNLLDRSMNYSATPPLSFMLQRICLDVFGPREWSLRLPAAASFLGAIVAVWWLGRRLLTPIAGGLAAILLATHPVVEHVAVAGRPYSVGLLLGVLAMQCCADLRRERPTWLRLAAWILVNLAIIQTHYMFAALWAAEFVWLLWPDGTPHLSAKQFAGCWAILLLLSLSVIPGLLRVWDHRQLLNWTTRTPVLADLESLALPIRWTWFRQPVWWGVAVLPILWQVVVGRRTPTQWLDVEHWNRTKTFLLRAAIWFVIPVGGLWLLGRFWIESVAAERYLVIYTPAVVVGLAGLLSTLRGKVAPIVAVAALVLLEGFVPRVIRAQERWDQAGAEWTEVGRAITERGTSSCLVIVGSGLTEMNLIPAYLKDPVLHDYVSCRLGRMYLQGSHTRLSLPMLRESWTSDVRRFYRHEIARACQGSNSPNSTRSAPSGVIWLITATDTDLLRATAAEAESVLRGAGAVEIERIEGQTLTQVLYLCPNSPQRDLVVPERDRA